MSNDLLKQIDELVANKTFNLDALDGIKKIKDGLESSERERKSLQTKYDGLYETSCSQIDEIERIKNVNKILQEEIDNINAYQAKAREAMWEKEVAKAQADAYKDALYTVFKPATVRETVHQTIPISQTYNGNTMVSQYHQETKTTKEEI